MVQLVAVDMDGTFLKKGNEYNRERFAKIYDEMEKREVRFVVASGNQYYQLRSFFPEIAEKISFVAENGALVISENEELFCGEFDQELVREILLEIEKNPEILTVLCGRKSAYILETDTDEFKAHSAIFYHRLKEVEDLKKVKEDRLFKFGLQVPIEKTDEIIQHLMDQFPGKIVGVSSGHGDIDLIIPGVHKAHGLQILQEKWQIPAEKMVAFGDGGNDIEMLQLAGQSYAMANGGEAVKKAAVNLAPSNQEEGVLVILEKLLGLEDEDI